MSADPQLKIQVDNNRALITLSGGLGVPQAVSFKRFYIHALMEGIDQFTLECRDCTSMDSTFLGVLAGFALELRKAVPKGSIVLTRMGQRNLELVRNLGLHKLLTVDATDTAVAAAPAAAAPLVCADRTELDTARLVLEAHENLVSADEDNRRKFQDVLVFMKNRVEQG